MEKTIDRLLADVRRETLTAVEKHPVFPAELESHDAAHVGRMLAVCRELNDGKRKHVTATAGWIFREEWFEFLEQVHKGDEAAARQELAQCIAVLCRVGLNLKMHMRHVRKGGAK